MDAPKEKVTKKAMRVNMRAQHKKDISDFIDRKKRELDEMKVAQKLQMAGTKTKRIVLTAEPKESNEPKESDETMTAIPKPAKAPKAPKTPKA